MENENKRKGLPKGSKNKIAAQGRKTIFASTTISGSPEEIKQIKILAESSGKSVSRFSIDLSLQK